MTTIRSVIMLLMMLMPWTLEEAERFVSSSFQYRCLFIFKTVICFVCDVVYVALLHVHDVIDDISRYARNQSLCTPVDGQVYVDTCCSDCIGPCSHKMILPEHKITYVEPDWTTRGVDSLLSFMTVSFTAVYDFRDSLQMGNDASTIRYTGFARLVAFLLLLLLPSSFLQGFFFNLYMIYAVRRYCEMRACARILADNCTIYSLSLGLSILDCMGCEGINELCQFLMITYMICKCVAAASLYVFRTANKIRTQANVTYDRMAASFRLGTSHE